MMRCHAHNDMHRIARGGDPEQIEKKEKKRTNFQVTRVSAVRSSQFVEVISISNLARTGNMKRRLVEGHSFIGAPAIKTTHCDDEHSGVQEDASFSTLGAS